MNVGHMLSKHLIAAGLLIIVIALGTGIYFIVKGKPNEGQFLPTQLTVTASASTVRYSLDPITLTATLTSNGDQVEEKVINWSVTPGIGVGIPPSTTDSFGQASIYFSTLPPLISSIKFSQLPKTLTFTVSFVGDNQYQESTGSVSIVVTPRT